MDTINKRPIILLGAGGHAKVLLSLLQLLDFSIVGVCAPELNMKDISSWRGVRVLEENLILDEYQADEIVLVNAIGQQPKQDVRIRVFERFKTQGYYFPSLIHPLACVDTTVSLSEGVQVMASVTIQADTQVGMNTILNTGSNIDHDVFVGDHAHVAPGAVLCGGVHIEKRAFVGSGAVLAQGIRVGEAACIGAGSSIVRDVMPGKKVIPAAVRD
ncbi:MAG: NeuD/PglB/VioB family sugar acetyltransferase [Gammaproteobacteria bacterium]|nr:NeuD/PglB/VioB family sugar acetyltransferase [Gammaproteobacteria bacterium]MCH9717251.1 NeuD/PglB/VioB family sugar acetyltransferase [Gammaproteobacteria bacterium]MCH9763215.1 NeuD/PglB/VioB family sugar acetyltransferase [Gammaproteobacteria bacterium]